MTRLERAIFFFLFSLTATVACGILIVLGTHHALLRGDETCSPFVRIGLDVWIDSEECHL